VSFAQIGMPTGHSVTNVYAAKTWALTDSDDAMAGGFNVTVAGMGGALMIVAPDGTEPAACVV